MGDVGWEAQEEGDICIQTASLLYFTPETNTALYSNNTRIKKKKSRHLLKKNYFSKSKAQASVY